MALTNRKQKRIENARLYVIGEMTKGRDEPAAFLRELELQNNRVARSTLYQWLRAERARVAADKSAVWSLGTDDTTRPDIVLEVLTGLFHASSYRRRTLTQTEARWVVRIATAAPRTLTDKDAGPWLLFQLARSYLRAEADSNTAELSRLDLYLANVFVSDKWSPPQVDKEV